MQAAIVAAFKIKTQIFKADGQYWCTIGGQRDSGIGAVLLYRSPDAQAWQFVGELTAAAHGHMIECPNFTCLHFNSFIATNKGTMWIAV